MSSWRPREKESGHHGEAREPKAVAKHPAAGRRQKPWVYSKKGKALPMYNIELQSLINSYDRYLQAWAAPLLASSA